MFKPHKFIQPRKIVVINTVETQLHAPEYRVMTHEERGIKPETITSVVLSFELTLKINIRFFGSTKSLRL